ncbi:MAG: hypothetical protein ACKPCP_07570 [Sphaerospermopsis kisseleviana]
MLAFPVVPVGLGMGAGGAVDCLLKLGTGGPDWRDLFMFSWMRRRVGFSFSLSCWMSSRSASSALISCFSLSLDSLLPGNQSMPANASTCAFLSARSRSIACSLEFVEASSLSTSINADLLAFADKASKLSPNDRASALAFLASS